MSSAKADLTLQDAHRNTALHLACSKVTIYRFTDPGELWVLKGRFTPNKKCIFFLLPV